MTHLIKLIHFALLVFSMVSYAAPDIATQLKIGKEIYESRCVMCHGVDVRATGALAQKSQPPAPDLGSCAYQRRLAEYPGVIVSSIVLMPAGNLIPNTLKENHIKVTPKQWTDQDLRDINAYILWLINQYGEHSCQPIKQSTCL